MLFILSAFLYVSSTGVAANIRSDLQYKDLSHKSSSDEEVSLFASKIVSI